MRIITGSAKGKRLITLDGLDVRPTSDKVKEGLFSALQFDIEGRRILDLFAGSGQLSLEAISRGAACAVLVDNSAASIKVIKKNVENCGFEEKVKIIHSDYASYCAMSRETFDIAFLDPPYASGLILPAIKAVLPLMSDYGLIVCEHPSDVELPESIGGFGVMRTYRYGKILVTVYRKEDRE